MISNQTCCCWGCCCCCRSPANANRCEPPDSAGRCWGIGNWRTDSVRCCSSCCCCCWCCCWGCCCCCWKLGGIKDGWYDSSSRSSFTGLASAKCNGGGAAKLLATAMGLDLSCCGRRTRCTPGAGSTRSGTGKAPNGIAPGIWSLGGICANVVLNKLAATAHVWKQCWLNNYKKPFWWSTLTRTPFYGRLCLDHWNNKFRIDLKAITTPLSDRRIS